jgi:hypothetical protein
LVLGRKVEGGPTENWEPANLGNFSRRDGRRSMVTKIGLVTYASCVLEKIYKKEYKYNKVINQQ